LGDFCIRFRYREAFQAACQRYAGLTEREREVLGLIVEGFTNKEIGRAMAASPRTVETHRANLFEEPAAPSLAHLIRHYAALVEEGDG
jgi:two-component system response regulator FixJ